MSQSAHRRHALMSVLDDYEPHDDTEREHLHTMRAVLGADADPFARDHFSPGHFTASAFVLSPARDELLLIHHAKLHRWLQPGGHIDANDADAVAAARRELREETGIVDAALSSPTPFDLDVHEIPARPQKGEPAHLHLDVRFLFVARTREAEAGSDALDHRWLPFAEVTEELTDASVMRALAKLNAL